MNTIIFFRRLVLAAGCIALGFSILAVSCHPAKTEAVSLGKLGGSIVGAASEQEKVKKSLDYYENDGRHELFAELKKQEGVVDDPFLNEELARIMTRLTNTIAKTEPSIIDKPYNYFINPQPGFNAYCTLGHNISVNFGVFSFLDYNEDKIAAVVAHELVHGQKKHPINGAKKKMTVEFVRKVAGAQMGGGSRLAVDIVAVNVKNVGVTKPNEWEADNIAYGYITDAGYNPGAPAAVWQRIIDTAGKSNAKGMFDDLLNPSTHPGEKERRDNYLKKLTVYSNNKVTVDSASGEIRVNNKLFMKPAAFANMSGLERSYLIAGNLANVYHSQEPLLQAYNDNGIVRIGETAIVQPCSDDQSAMALTAILNGIK